MSVDTASVPGQVADAGAEPDLETYLGNPHDPANPVSFPAVLAADERGELLAEGERALDGYGLNAEFVPRALGGRFDRADRLAQVLRAVFRRDTTLGVGYGVTTFIAATPVWTDGTAQQRRWMADLLLRHGKASAGYNELAHGTDFSRAELRARPAGDHYRVTGRKEMVGNLARADAVTLFARTDDRPGSRSHSHLLLDMAALPAEHRRHLRRYRTAGVRGVLLGGLEFTDCPVPSDAVVGEPGGAMETVLRAFQVTRGVLPGMAVGIVDTQLRTVLRFALDRRLYGLPVAELPHARTTLVDGFLDLLIGDCLATVVARALHLLPDQTSVYSAAVKYLVPKLLQEAAHRLSVVLGARSYLRDGPYGIFQKNLRDLLAATLTHASAAVCQATIIPQLPRLAQQGWRSSPPPPPALFRLGDPLPPLDFGALGLSARGVDSLTATLRGYLAEPGAQPAVARLCGLFTAELDRLAEACAELPPRDRTVIAGRRSFDLTDRYATVLAAAACLGVWRHQRDDPFLGDVPWLAAALSRLAGRLGLHPGTAPDGLERHLYTELLARHRDNRGFDLVNRRLAG
ncbi:acyl-CoA dehydrogenase family protein [Plantactinospora endophytica]|uniref:Acyl-CoA dehydrogenase n=1 Tax=Plantactinospora endophytica TaxID=673535 RepID=A0ABQ4EAS2_9ACTN|nr:acyl-CoA dehydrogenase family protein [Plantactinospora endophytica]GIG91761.1 acyl-CoA dehydrogenase [Plantactinospora endophytica]